MQNRYRKFHRGTIYYVFDKTTGRNISLKTANNREADRIALAYNQAVEQPQLNVAMARAYLSVKSPEMAERTWDAGCGRWTNANPQGTRTVGCDSHRASDLVAA